MTETASERRRREQRESEEGRSTGFNARGYPSRSRDLAIFEYAPGRGIVVDGVVRESAGVTLNWQRPVNDAGVREVQSLRSMWSCRRCGALTSKPSAAQSSVCEECGSADRRDLRFLPPAGFAVDVRFRVHDDPSDLGGSRVVDPWVSARTSVWRSLPDPRVGRIRTNADGMVFWFNPGPHEHGFAVCLHCGRAEAEETSEGGQRLLGHRPLRGLPVADDGETCTGSPDISPFAISRRLNLGHEIRTDVTELQLYDCGSKEAATAIALALREAVAARLGIDPDEMGFAAPEVPHPAGRANWSAVIFDRASGGAGFAAALARDPVAMVADARDRLDCTRLGRCGDPEAVRACPRCVLGSDAQHAAEQTDRKTAQALLSDSVERLTLPEEFMLFGPKTTYEPAPLATALNEIMAASSDAELILRLPSEAQSWDLDGWPARDLLERWGARGRTVRIQAARQELMEADPVTRRKVAFWAQRARARLEERGDGVDGATILAAIRRSGTTVLWGSSDEAAAEIGATWAATSSAPVVRGVSPYDWAPRAEIDPHYLIRERVRETILDVASELDGPAEGFGARLRTMLSGANSTLAEVLSAPCLSIRYSDRYLFNPLSVRLAAELVAGFSDGSTRIEVVTLPARRQGAARSGRKVSNDWADMAHRNFVLSHLLGRISPDWTLDVSVPDVEHRRTLEFQTLSGRGTIFLDQGVGSWRSDAPFDSLADEADQLIEIQRPFTVANGPDGTFIAVRLD